MSMVIANNMQAVNTKRQFAISGRGQSSAMEKLSSGYKINTGKDDPSGLVISEKLRSQLNGLKRAQQNTEEAINVMGIAEGALNEMNAILKKMKALAIHSNNTGVTSPDQINADQAEMDSAIQTLDRIAQTTKFSEDNLLNGAKDIAYDTTTSVKGTQQNKLLDARETSFKQIFKRDDYAVAISFTGTQSADEVTGLGEVDFTKQAAKAYLEVDTSSDPDNQAQITDGKFTQDQQFTLTGTKGSRAFTFNKGETVATMVSQIKSVADSTGIDAALVFNSDQVISKTMTGTATPVSGAIEDLVVSTGLKSVDVPPLDLKITMSDSGAPADSTLSDALRDALKAAGLESLEFSVKVTGDDAMQIIATDNKGGSYDISAAGWAGTGSVTGVAAVTTGGTGITAVADALKAMTFDVVDSTGTAGDINGKASIPVGDIKIAPGALADATLTNIYSAGSGVLTVEDTDAIFDSALADIFDGLSDEMKASFMAETGVSIKASVEGDDQTGYKVTLDVVGASNINYASETFDSADLGISTSNGTVASHKIASGGVFDDLYVTVVDAGPAFDDTGTDPVLAGTAAGGAVATPNAINYTDGYVTGAKEVGFEGAIPTADQAGGMVAGGAGAARNAGTVAIFNNEMETLDGVSTGMVKRGVTGVNIANDNNAATDDTGIQLGLNTDGQGRLFVKFVDDGSFELYKDASMSAESLVATGINGQEITQSNNSGLKGITLNITGEELTKQKGVYITFAGVEGQSQNYDYSKNPPELRANDYGVSYNGDVVGKADKALFDQDKTLITGVELGKNTDSDGRIYLETVYDDKNGTVRVNAYKDRNKKPEDLVAQSELINIKDFEGATGGSATIILNEKRNADDTAGTGLGIVLSTGDASTFAKLLKDGQNVTLASTVEFKNLGARIFAQDYGSANYIKATQDKGNVFSYYSAAGDNDSKRMVDATSGGVTVQVNGQDATLSVNGTQVKTNGLELSMATQDIQADLVFNEGKVGSTTLAQVGYDTASIFTKIGALNLGSVEAETDGKYAGLSGLMANAGHVTNERVDNFQGGMQLQIGEGAGDQNRTVVAIKSLTSENLGRVTQGGYWEGNAVYSEKTFTMKDVFGGGMASLKQRPTLAMAIIEQSIADVSELRAQIGAVQSNMLQTNSNNLAVTMENIQKTESGIRDADMADEMTEFTKNQVLQSAAMSMMSQANQSSQNVLQLLR